MTSAAARPRVLLTLGASTGGIGTHVASLAAHLADRAQLLLWAPPATLARPDLAALAGHGVRLVPQRGHDWRSQRRLLENADVVHAHGFHAAARCLPLMWGRSRTALITTWHNLPPLQSALSRSAGRAAATLVARRSRLSLCASSDLVSVALALGARDARLCPISAPMLPPAGRAPIATRAELFADADSAESTPAGSAGAGPSQPPRPLLVAVARLAPQKRLDLLLASIGQLSARRPQPLLVIAGTGPLHDALAARIATESLPVRLLGHRDDVADLLAAADVAVSSSEWEARSLVAQEALRAGVPFVGTDVGGVGELVGDAGLLVPAGDPGTLAAAVARVLDDPALATRLRAAGPARAAGWPDEAQTADQVWACYQEVLTDQAPAEPADQAPADAGTEPEPSDTPGEAGQPPH